jgi:hypothetical protein
MHNWLRQHWLSVRLMMVAGVVWAGMPTNLFAEEKKAEEKKQEPESSRRAAAVALNYSRASFHRIRRNPSVRVLWEEQDKILNHINLNGIADADVVKLYGSVLDEIAGVQLADREKELLREKYQRQFHRDLSVNALTLATSVATAQYATAVRTGCTSWWDYRNQAQNRELDVWRVDKERMTKLVEKSTQFLDISWKTARERQIPDRWLVRGDDLDKLEDAWQETDPTVRLRVLKRMEPFMEAYPPYWYYVARTQQAQGQLFAAGETYGKLVELGQGHFRKDEMLASGLANRALIQAYLSQPSAPDTAKLALSYATDVWEANLICASVLQRHHRYTDAEDAILRNLDVGLERGQSRVALVSLYVQSDDRVKLARQLSDPNVVRELPPGLLVSSAAHLGEAHTPAQVTQLLQRTLQATPRFNLGRDDLVVQAGANWRLQQATLTLQLGEVTLTQPRLSVQRDVVSASFDGVAEFSRATEAQDAVLTIQYPDAPAVKLTLQVTGLDPSLLESVPPLVLTTRRYPVYRVTAVEQDQNRLSLHHGTLRPSYAPGGSTGPTALPAGATSVKPANDDPYVTTPPIDIPVVSPL